MKIGIMQPYFMPYIGYWQLMNAVDKYVVYDDVNYITGGWIHRNRILMNDTMRYINLPVLGVSQNKLINEILVNRDGDLFTKVLRTLRCAYGGAPYFDETMAIMESILSSNKKNIAEFLMESFHIVGDYLGIETEIILSSQIVKDNTLRGQAKILEICEKLEGTQYYNAIGGKNLYRYEDFEEKGIKLNFLQTSSISYMQFDEAFHPNLSIIDVLMFNSKEQIKSMLGEFTVISK